MTDSATTPTAWPLVGRLLELERIAQARRDGRRGVVVHGRAGVGKSRLAREALAAAERDGALVVRVQATRSAATVPLGAFAGLIVDDLRSDDPLELMRRSAELLAERAAGRDVVLGVDDAQLLDPTSAALVLHLALAGAAFVIATVRSGEPCPDAIVSLWKDADAERLELAELDEEETGRLVEAIAGGPVEQAARLWMFETARGNALYVRELVGGALDGRALRRVGELWQMPRRPPVSATLAELVATRMVGLDAEVRGVLELLALGEPLRGEELAALAGEEALLAAEARGFVVVDVAGGDDEVRLTHPLYGEVLAAQLGTLRAGRLRRRLAETLGSRSVLTADDALRVARWLQDAGDEVPRGLLADAARAANLAGDPDLAATFAAQAVAAGEGLDAVTLLARAHVVRKRFADAEAVLAEAEAEAAGTTQEEAAAYLEQRAIAVLYWGLADPDRARALLDRAQDWWPGQEWARRLDPMRLHLASLSEGFEEAVAVTTAILADPGLDPGMRRQIEPLHTVNLYYSGRTQDAHALAERLRPAVPMRDHSDSIALMNWAIIGLETGEDLRGLEGWMTQTLQAGVRASDDEAAGMAALTLAGVRLFQGRLTQAARWLAEAEVHLERRDPFGALVAARASAVFVAFDTGDPDATAAALARGRELDGWAQPLPSLHPYVVRAEAFGRRAQEDAAGAQRLLREAAEASMIPGYAAQLTYDAFLAGAPAGELAPLQAELAERCDSRIALVYAQHLMAHADGQGLGILEAAEELSEMGMWHYACLAAADASASFLREGRQDSARRAATRSRVLFEQGEGGVMPHIDGLSGIAVMLTDRERQLVKLARRGLTNVEMADQLVVSVRTVESHIYRAMRKLGVSDRRDL